MVNPQNVGRSTTFVGKKVERRIKPLRQRYRVLVRLWRDECDPNTLRLQLFVLGDELSACPARSISATKGRTACEASMCGISLMAIALDMSASIAGSAAVAEAMKAGKQVALAARMPRPGREKTCACTAAPLKSTLPG